MGVSLQALFFYDLTNQWLSCRGERTQTFFVENIDETESHVHPSFLVGNKSVLHLYSTQEEDPPKHL